MDSSSGNVTLNALKYTTKWYAGAVEKNSNMINEYNKKSDDYIKSNIKKRKVDDTFSEIIVTDKNTFLDSLSAF